MENSKARKKKGGEERADSGTLWLLLQLMRNGSAEEEDAQKGGGSSNNSGAVDAMDSGGDAYDSGDASGSSKMKLYCSESDSSETVDAPSQDAKPANAIMSKPRDIKGRFLKMGQGKARSQSLSSEGSEGASSRRLYKPISLETKLGIIQEHDAGATRQQILEKFNVKKSTYYDIIKAKAKYRKLARSAKEPEKLESHHIVSKSPQKEVDEAVWKWYQEEMSTGRTVVGSGIQETATRLAGSSGISDFKASKDWLWKFCRRHGILNAVVKGEPPSETLSVIEPFADKLKKLIIEEELEEYEIYNADETGLFWHSFPCNVQTLKGEAGAPERVSAMCCTNRDGSHRVKPCIVGRLRCPNILRGIMDKLPVDYYSSPSAWFTQGITLDWFRKFEAQVREYQARVHRVRPEDARAVLLLDNAPSHPSEKELISENGKIRALFLPADIPAFVQPMNQGVIESCKRHYKKNFLHQCLVVVEDGMNDEGYVDKRREKTRAKLRNYSIKDAVFNWADAWKSIKTSTLRKAWNNILGVSEVAVDLEGFPMSDMAAMLSVATQSNITTEELEDWLDEDADLPGHQDTEEEIASRVRVRMEEDKLDEEPEYTCSLPKSLDAVDYLLNLVDERGASFHDHYEHLRQFRRVIQLEMAQSVVNKKRKSMVYSGCCGVDNVKAETRNVWLVPATPNNLLLHCSASSPPSQHLVLRLLSLASAFGGEFHKSPECLIGQPLDPMSPDDMQGVPLSTCPRVLRPMSNLFLELLSACGSYRLLV